MKKQMKIDQMTPEGLLEMANGRYLRGLNDMIFGKW